MFKVRTSRTKVVKFANVWLISRSRGNQKAIPLVSCYTVIRGNPRLSLLKSFNIVFKFSLSGVVEKDQSCLSSRLLSAVTLFFW